MSDQFPFGYERIAATTWAYLSSLLLLCVFFKFNRFWSVRNFDLFLIILLAPGILLYEGGRQWVALESADNRGTLESAVVVQPDGTVSVTAPDSMDRRVPGEQNGVTNQPGSSPENENGTGTENDSDDDNGNQSDNRPATGTQTSGVQSGAGPPDDASDPGSDSSADLRETAPDVVEDNNVGGGTDDSIDLDSTGLDSTGLDSRGRMLKRFGYYWLFGVAALFLLRMLLDPLFVRRPQLDPNLTIGGLVFMGCSLMIFLFANIITAQPNEQDLSGAREAVQLLQRNAAGEDEALELQRRGPGYRLFNLFPIIPSFGDRQEIKEILETDPDRESQIFRYVIAAKSLAIVSQNLIVLGLVLFGYIHFRNFKLGVGIAVIYLMLPYTAVFTGHVMHALPAALLIWGLVLFHRPGLAGIFIGLATGVSYYPLFLLPLWISFYWEKGRTRFLTGFFCSLILCVAGLVFTSYDIHDFLEQLRAMFGFWLPQMDGLEGIWALGWDDVFRIPLLVGFVALSVSFAFWPTQKTIGTLVAYSCAVMVAVQFWHGFGGGLYLAWYVPLALMAIFRPNTEGRFATVELGLAEENRRLRTADSADEILPID